MKRIILLLALLVPVMCAAQHDNYRDHSKKFKKKWKDKIGSEKLIRSWYNYVVTQKSDDEYILRVFFPETRVMTHYVTFDDQRMTNRQGVYHEYTDEGLLLKEGNYANDAAQGHWKIYKHNSDILEEEGNYDESDKHGLWKTYDFKGRLKEEVNYYIGEKEGAFIVYDTLGNITNSGEYREDTIFTQTKEETLLKEKVVEQLPYLAQVDHITDVEVRHQVSDNALLKYLYSSVKYPRSARKYGITGRALVQFVVEKDGSVGDIKVLRGYCRDISNSITKTVKKMPRWKPGLQDGEPVRVIYTLPVVFKLEG